MFNQPHETLPGLRYIAVDNDLIYDLSKWCPDWISGNMFIDTVVEVTRAVMDKTQPTRRLWVATLCQVNEIDYVITAEKQVIHEFTPQHRNELTNCVFYALQESIERLLPICVRIDRNDLVKLWRVDTDVGYFAVFR